MRFHGGRNLRGEKDVRILRRMTQVHLQNDLVGCIMDPNAISRCVRQERISLRGSVRRSLGASVALFIRPNVLSFYLSARPSICPAICLTCSARSGLLRLYLGYSELLRRTLKTYQYSSLRIEGIEFVICMHSRIFHICFVIVVEVIIPLVFIFLFSEGKK